MVPFRAMQKENTFLGHQSLAFSVLTKNKQVLLVPSWLYLIVLMASCKQHRQVHYLHSLRISYNNQNLIVTIVCPAA